jgi:hypothetical protein
MICVVTTVVIIAGMINDTVDDMTQVPECE